MKKYLILLFITLCFSNVSVQSAENEIKEICSWIVNEAYPEALQEFPNNHFYAVVGSDGRCEYGQGTDEESAFNNCEKWKKENNINGECKPFAIGKEIIWKNGIKELENKTSFEPTEGGNGSVSFNEEGFVLRQDQKSLTYINSKDDIPGRSLYDQEDITENYQVHIIYLLAKDSKDKKWDTKGAIEKIVLNSNKKLKKKIKKQFRLDMTKEGKVDVSFVRVDKTKEQINAGDAATYFSRQIIKNGFYHPKKTYAIFYQDRYQREWGQVGQGVFFTPKGMIEVRTGVTYLGQESLGEAFVPYIHEMIHALGFVQHCAPCREKSGIDTHCYLGLDIMSENGDSGKGFAIDKKSNEYYGHSNANCQMDMKKSVFLEPTEKDFQLKPRAPNNSECRVSLSQKIYNHERALACLNRLDF